MWLSPEGSVFVSVRIAVLFFWCFEILQAQGNAKRECLSVAYYVQCGLLASASFAVSDYDENWLLAKNFRFCASLSAAAGHLAL